MHALAVYGGFWILIPDGEHLPDPSTPESSPAADDRARTAISGPYDSPETAAQLICLTLIRRLDATQAHPCG